MSIVFILNVMQCLLGGIKENRNYLELVLKQRCSLSVLKA